MTHLGTFTDSNTSRGVTLQFRFLHVVGFLLTLPVVLVTRLVSARGREPRESVFAETNRSVLTALGTAFMA